MVMSAAALWFLVAPFVVPLSAVVFTGTIATAALLAWSGAGYLRLARQARSAGALVIGVGLTLIASEPSSRERSCRCVIDLGATQGRLSGVTVITTLFVALGMFILVFEDMTDELRLTNRQLAGANEEVRRLAITDAQTGCHNRRFFDEVERRELERHRRYGTPLSVVFIDVNHFKRLNDTLGHDRGDAVLWMIGNLLRGHVRQSDYAIRWGGDEFLLLLVLRRGGGQVQGRGAEGGVRPGAGRRRRCPITLASASASRRCRPRKASGPRFVRPTAGCTATNSLNPACKSFCDRLLSA